MSDNWVDMGQKLLTPDMKEKLLSKINEINTEYKPDNEDLINKPEHYQGKTLELTDLYQDFFENTSVMDKYIMDIIKYAIRYRKKGLILDNLRKIKNALKCVSKLKTIKQKD